MNFFNTAKIWNWINKSKRLSLRMTKSGCQWSISTRTRRLSSKTKTNRLCNCLWVLGALIHRTRIHLRCSTRITFWVKWDLPVWSQKRNLLNTFQRIYWTILRRHTLLRGLNKKQALIQVTNPAPRGKESNQMVSNESNRIHIFWRSCFSTFTIFSPFYQTYLIHS